MLKVKIPKGFMNTAVTTDNFLIVDTNDSANWMKLKYKLPEGKWFIYSSNEHEVILVEKNIVNN
jgi:phage repressor protein C with HTH and peptisase S24 domain